MTAWYLLPMKIQYKIYQYAIEHKICKGSFETFSWAMNHINAEFTYEAWAD